MEKMKIKIAWYRVGGQTTKEMKNALNQANHADKQRFDYVTRFQLETRFNVKSIPKIESRLRRHAAVCCSWVGSIANAFTALTLNEIKSHFAHVFKRKKNFFSKR